MTNIVAINTVAATPAQQLSDLAHRYSAAVAAGRQSERDKLLVFAGGFLFATAEGGVSSDAMNSHYVFRGITNKVDDHNRAAQLVLGLTIERITDKKDKKDARNSVDRLSKLMKALEVAVERNPAIAFWTEERLVAHIELNGGLNGVVDLYLETDDEPEKEVEEADLEPIETAIADATLRLPIEAVVGGADPIVGLMRVIDGQLHLVPLAQLPGAEMARLTAYLPAPDADLSDDVRFASMIGLTCGLFDVGDSDEVARPNEEEHAASPKLPSHPIVLVRDGDLSIAASRVQAGMVVMISPKQDATAKVFEKLDGTHLNGCETNKLIAGVAGPRQRAMFESTTFNEETSKLTLVSRDTRVKDVSLTWRPMSAFGSSKNSRQWTNVVREEANFVITSEVEMEPGKLPAELEPFARKAGAGRHDVLIRITKGAVTLAQGAEAKSVSFASSGDGTGKATVSRLDFARAITLAAQLGAVAMRVSVDPKGLASIQLETALAHVGICLPTLLEGGARNPALLVQVERPAKSSEQPTD